MKAPLRAGLYAAIAIVALAIGQAQSSANAPVTSQPTTYQWPKVVLNFLVEPKKENAAPVAISDLKLLEDGAPQSVRSAYGPGSPVSLCILLDISGSMTSKAKYARDAALTLVQHLPAGSEVMIVRFAEKSYLPVPFTPVSNFDPQILDRQEVGHRTALYDSLIITEAYFLHFARNPRRALVIISDCQDTASKHRIQDAERSLLAPGGPFVYALGLFDPNAAAPEGRWAPLLIRSMHIHMTRTDEPKSLPELAEGMARLIDTQYAFTYTSTLSVRDKRRHKLEVKLEAPDARIKFEAMPGYYIPEE